jgi:hypothetical protein
VALADALVKSGYVTIEGDCAALTARGAQWAETTGLSVNAPRTGSHRLRLCLDWTERRFHFAGSLPSTILRYLLDRRLLKRGDERSLIVTPQGKAWFAKLGVDTDGALAVGRRQSPRPQRTGASYPISCSQGNTISSRPAK